MSDSFVTPWMVARQAPLSMGFLRQEYWSGLPFPSPWDLPNPGTEPTSPALAGGFFTTEPPGKRLCLITRRKMIAACDHQLEKHQCLLLPFLPIINIDNCGVSKGPQCSGVVAAPNPA